MWALLIKYFYTGKGLVTHDHWPYMYMQRYHQVGQQLHVLDSSLRIDKNIMWQNYSCLYNISHCKKLIVKLDWYSMLSAKIYSKSVLTHQKLCWLLNFKNTQLHKIFICQPYSLTGCHKTHQQQAYGPVSSHNAGDRYPITYLYVILRNISPQHHSLSFAETDIQRRWMGQLATHHEWLLRWSLASVES